MKIFFQIIIAFFIINISFAQTNYYVSPTGSDANDGSQANPWATIEYAVNNVSNPSVDEIIINISGGIYDLSNDQIDINRNFANLTLIGEGIDNTFIQSAADTSLSNSRVIEIYSGNTVSLKNLTIRYGRFKGSTHVSNGGGGILNSGGTLTINFCKITENSGDRSEKGVGGGISNYRGNLTVMNSTISHNTGATGGTAGTGAQGGGICSYNGILNVYNSTIDSNYAPLTGGGIAILLSGANGAPTADAVFNMENSTVYGNTAKLYGGVRIAIFGYPLDYDIITNINSCTIFRNSAISEFGGLGLSTPSNFNIKNSIVAGNIQNLNTDSTLSDLTGSSDGIIITSGGYNVFQTISRVSINGAPNNGIGLDPLLLPLADNNSTNGTKSCATEVGSPAIDAIPGGNGAPLLDQRGAIRNGDYDIGAYEYWLDNGLPVELTSFTAQVRKDIVILNWKTATEVNNFGFDIERALSSTLPHQIWEKVGFVNGNGNSNSPKTYSFSDNNPSGGSKFLYRLKQIDNDGQFEYSNIIEVEVNPTGFSLFQNYPNPFNPVTKINYSIPFDSKVIISIYSITGELVKELVNDNVEPGSYSVDFYGSNLASGMYIYKMAAGSFVKTYKMMLMK